MRDIAQEIRLNTSERQHLLNLYCAAVRALEQGIASLAPGDLDRAVDAEWSPRSVIHHLADAELVESVRLRRILLEDDPMLPWIDEAEHARRLHYERAIETSVGVFASVVTANIALVEQLSEAEWLRAGRHSVSGPYSVEDWLRKMSQHAHDHVAQMLRVAGRDVTGT